MSIFARYGRPDIIIESLIQKTKSCPHPKDYRPESILEYADMVRNLVVTVKVLDHKHHLMNPRLLKELVSKLSTNMKISWGMFASEIVERHINIEDFSNWLKKTANAMSLLPTSVSGNFIQSDTKRNFVYVTKEKDCQSPRPCLFCKKGCRNLEVCVDFKNATVDNRWDFVKKNKMCFGCLRLFHSIRHCKKKQICNVDGCTYSYTSSSYAHST